MSAVTSTDGYGSVDGADGVILRNVPFIQQPADELCWATCCEMVFRSFGKTGPQVCELASEYNGGACCPDPRADGGRCNQPQWPDDAYRKYGFSNFLYGQFPLSFENVEYEINRSHPVNALLQYGFGEDRGKHLVLICGYYSNQELLVYDPLTAEPARYSYSYVRSAYNRGHWAGSYYNLTPG